MWTAVILCFFWLVIAIALNIWRHGGFDDTIVDYLTREEWSLTGEPEAHDELGNVIRR